MKNTEKLETEFLIKINETRQHGNDNVLIVMNLQS